MTTSTEITRDQWFAIDDEIRRSIAIHPNWGHAIHLSFLENDSDLFVDLDATYRGRTVRARVVEFLFARGVYS